jgi:ABC-type lipoprotein release transport system permease subunit
MMLMMPRPRPETYEKLQPQITQITQIFFLFVFSHLLSFSTSYLPSSRVPSRVFAVYFNSSLA